MSVKDIIFHFDSPVKIGYFRIMKETVIIALLFVATALTGCSSEIKCPLRSQVRVGMTEPEIIKLYADLNGEVPIERLTAYRELLDEKTVNNYVFKTYRYNLWRNRDLLPFLLTFQSRRLTEQEIQEKRAEWDAKFGPLSSKDVNGIVLKWKEGKELTDPEILCVMKEILMLPDINPEFYYTTPVLANIELDEKALSRKAIRDAAAQQSRTKLSDVFRSAAEAGQKQHYIVDLHIKEQQQNDILEIDAYGPGIHANRYGQPVTLWPDFGSIPGEYLEIKPDAYGPGIHSDQYDRPVREYSWP